jgi:DNA-directed RNA polymerase
LKYYKVGQFTEKVSGRQAKNSIAPNFIHSLDSALVHITVDKAWAKGVRGMACIHDSFGGLAEDMDLINDAIREAAAEMYSQPVLEKFVQEVLAQIGPDATITLEMPALGSFDPRDVAFSKYFVS